MIVHTINKYVIPNVVHISSRWRGREAGTEDHKKFIFNRTHEHHKFQEGDHVVYKKEPAVITHIVTDYSVCLWDVLKALPIEIYVPSLDEIIYVHPSDIRRNK